MTNILLLQLIQQLMEESGLNSAEVSKAKDVSNKVTTTFQLIESGALLITKSLIQNWHCYMMFVGQLKDMTRHLTLLQLSQYIGCHSRMSLEQKLQLVEDTVQRYRYGLSFGESFTSVACETVWKS